MKISIKELYNQTPQKHGNLSINPEKIDFKYISRQYENSLKSLPVKNEIQFIWTKAQFSSIRVIEDINRQAGIISELWLSSFTINTGVFNEIILMILSGKVISCWLYLSNTIEKRLPKIYDQLKAYEYNKIIRLKYGWNHSKICLAMTDHDYFCLEGSGNFSDSARYEQYIFSNHKDIYEFRRRNISDCFNC